jgi:Asp-tRNA(Asn)/Glu-tRNA(Gln) amidotransferase A subunit family amidase
MASLHELSAHELSQAYAAGTVSPVEVTQAVIDHIGRWEPALGATYAFDPDGALHAARASEARWRAGQALGPLDGVPVTVKENIATKGVPLPSGTAAVDLVPAAEDAPPAARLKEAGCVIVSKTTMPDYGMLSSGLSSFHTLARNPWDLRMNPGGSSAGAGAAAAAGYGPLHLGTDIGGSIRLPAGWCGVFGLKPSNGRIPIKPPYVGRVAGPMTRSVTDAAMLMRVLSQPDARDSTSLPLQAIDWLALEPGQGGYTDEAVSSAGVTGSAPASSTAGTSAQGGPGEPAARSLKGLRLGLWLDAGWGAPLQPEIEQAITAAARRFEAAGAIVEPVPAFTTPEVPLGIDLFWRMRSWLDISALAPERREKVLPYIREWVAPAAGYSATEVFRGFSQIAVLRDATVAACAPFDFVLSPVSSMPSFPAEWAGPLNDPARAMHHIGYTLPFNMSEQPAASIDCGHTASGLPIGLQIIGHRHDDLGVLRLARAWERLRPTPRPWPQPPQASSRP